MEENEKFIAVLYEKIVYDVEKSMFIYKPIEVLQDCEIDFENEYTFHSSINNLEININKWMVYDVHGVHDLIDIKRYTHRFVWCVLAMNKIAELYFSGDYIAEVPDGV